MAQKSKRNYILDTAQLVVWVCVLFLPSLINFTLTGNAKASILMLRGSVQAILPIFLLYCLNYYLLVPRFLFGQRKEVFWVVNAVLLAGWNLFKFIPRGQVPQEVIDAVGRGSIWSFTVVGVLASLFMESLVILLAVGLRQVMRMNDIEREMQEERRKTAEAELTWLKSQLNPHFLFNTLNNTSSLTQIDPDKAQESIGQLSDLLRYALYDSEAVTVPVASEVEFMNNYIDLMALRCNDLTTVEKDLEAPQGHVQVAPLLFISLVENAFKHGVNARYPSFVKVSLRAEGGSLVFRCENSLFEKQGSDHIGSGIGLENMKRRLELLYPGKYTYSQHAGDGTYSVEVTLDLT